LPEGLNGTDSEGMEPPRVIEAQEFRLVDRERNIRGRYGIDADGCPSFVLMERNGEPAITLTVDEHDIPRFILHHAGETTFTITQDAAGNPRLWLHGAADLPDTNGEPRAALLLDSNGVACLDLFARGSNEAGISLHVGRDGAANLGIWADKADKPIVALSVREDAAGEISLRDENGNVLWAARRDA